MLRPVRALAVAIAALTLAATVAEAAQARVVARTPRPIAGVAADGADAVLLVGRRITRVDLATGVATVVCRRCGGDAVAAGGGAIATVATYERESDESSYWIETGDLVGILPGRRPTVLARSGDAVDEPLRVDFGDVVVGAGRIAWTKDVVHYCNDPCTDPLDFESYFGFEYEETLSAHSVGAPFDLDRAALAIARDGRTLLADGTLLAADGSVLRVLPSAALDGRGGRVVVDGDLIAVETPAGIVAIDAVTGAISDARRIGPTASLVDLRDGVALLVRGRDLIALRLADGHRALLVHARRGSRLLAGGFADAGAVYAVDRGGSGSLGVVRQERIGAALGG